MAGWLNNLTSYDELSLILGSSFALVFLLAKWVAPVSLVHPLLLGRQAEVDKVRKSGESAVYRNYGTGFMGILPRRPAREVQLLTDLLKKDFQQSRKLWGTDITNSELQSRSSALAAGFLSRAGLVPGESNVLLVLNDGINWVLTDLALSKINVPSFTIASLEFLAPVLEHYPPSAIVCHADLATQILEIISDSNEHAHHQLIVIGRNAESDAHLTSQRALKTHRWEELLEAGKQETNVALPTPKPSDVITVAFHSVSNGVPQGTKITHENVVAGVTATRVLPPLNDLLTPADMVYSAYSPSTALGRTILYTALYEGTHFSTTQSTVLDPPYNLRTPRDVSDLISTANSSEAPAPTVFFGDASHAESITRDVLNEAKMTSPFFNLACRHKFYNLEEGHLANSSFWDRFIFNSARRHALGKSASVLRFMVIADPVVNAGLLPIQVALSIPHVRILSHPAVCGPICASHALDLQSFPSEKGEGDDSSSSHVGPPSVNIEAKLVGIDDAAVEKKADPVGELIIRGPSIGETVPTNDAITEVAKDGWMSIQRRALVRSNGTFVVIDS